MSVAEGWEGAAGIRRRDDIIVARSGGGRRYSGAVKLYCALVRMKVNCTMQDHARAEQCMQGMGAGNEDSKEFFRANMCSRSGSGSCRLPKNAASQLEDTHTHDG